MLINLSNHPFSEWPENQKQTALSLYHSILDLPFPIVNPEGDEIYIHNITDDYLEKILNVKKNHPDKFLTVHLMGELSFCFALVKKLQSNHIPCVVSTTQRIVETISEHQKISTFKFVKFRKYL